MTTFTGADAIGAYRVESSFNNHDTTANTGGFRTFGRNVTIDTFEGTNNGVELFEFCQRAPTKVIQQNFEGTFSASFVLSTFNFLELFDNNPSDTDDSDSDEQDTFNFTGKANTFELAVQRKESDSATNKIVRVATGCLPQSVEFDVQVDGLVEVTINGIYAGEELRDVNINDEYAQLPPSKDSLDFSDVTLTYQGTELELPRGVTISLEVDDGLLSTLGSRTATDFSRGSLTGSVDITHAVEVEETRTIESMYGVGGSEDDAYNTSSVNSNTVSQNNSITIVMDNRTNAPGTVKATFNLEGFTESYGESGIDVEEEFVEADITETLSGQPQIVVEEDFSVN